MSNHPVLTVYVIHYESPYSDNIHGVLTSEGFYASLAKATARLDKITKAAANTEMRNAYSVRSLDKKG